MKHVYSKHGDVYVSNTDTSMIHTNKYPWSIKINF